jgi:hypothetical protein
VFRVEKVFQINSNSNSSSVCKPYSAQKVFNGDTAADAEVADADDEDVGFLMKYKFDQVHWYLLFSSI